MGRATDTIGLIIFKAANKEAAEEYVSDMCARYGHTNVFNLSPLPNGTGVDELCRLFPRLSGDPLDHDSVIQHALYAAHTSRKVHLIRQNQLSDNK